LQAVQLAAAVGTLAGRGGGGLIDTFRQNVGLDDFDITDEITAKGTVDADGETSIGIFFERDY
jgi:translocation and assembly module TamB